jgi:GntR family transcriptional regulator/MocR family aminotransferase
MDVDLAERPRSRVDESVGYTGGHNHDLADYDSEYRFGGRPLEALHGLDGEGRVLYVGTFSKVLFPSLRLGYLVAPPDLLPAVRAVRRFSDIHSPVLEQMALADFIAEGHFARYLRRMRPLYQARRDALVEALRWELGDRLDIVVPQAGLNLAAWLPAGMSGQAVAGRIAEQGLILPTLSQFSLRPMERDGWLFGFAGASPETLRAGVRVLARTIRGRARSRPEVPTSPSLGSQEPVS